MSITSIDSTNFTLSPDTNRQVTMSGGFQNLEVASVDGAGTVAFKVSTSAAPTCNSNGNDTWLLPAAIGAARSFTFTDAAHTNCFVTLAVSATNHVLVTTW